MTDNEIKKALDVLDRFDLFGGQRAGRELWNEKPVDVQNEDIENFVKDVVFLKDLINRLQAEINHLENESDALLADIDFRDAEIERLKYLLDYEEKKYDLCAKRFFKEGVKEFAEELNNKGMFPHEINDDYAVGLETINNLLKEKVGEDNA